MVEKNSSPATRQIILAAAGAFSMAVILFLIWYFAIRTPYVEAFTSLKSEDAAIIVKELDKNKVPYKLADGGQSILVPQDQVDATRVNILGGDLPLKGIVGFELFNESDMGLTEFAQRINYQRALQGELARTLMSFRNIETARVHLSLPESGIFEKQQRPAKASATLQAKAGMSIDANTVTAAQRLIVSAVPDLETSNVSVLDANGQLLTSSASMEDKGWGEDYLPSPEEQDLIAKVTAIAAPLFNDDQLRVTVRVIDQSNALSESRTFKPVSQTENLPYDQSQKGASENTERSSARNYRMEIRISTNDSISDDVRSQLLYELGQVIEYNPANGDRLMIQPSLQAIAPAAPVASQPKTEAIAEPKDDNQLLWQLPAIVLGVIISLFLLFLLLFLVRKSRHTDVFDTEKRMRFSSKLQQLLTERQQEKDGIAR